MKKTEEAQLQYNMFLESGELLEILPGMKGEWEIDKKVFLAHWEKNMKFLEDNEL